MIAVIIAGGKGKRLGQLAANRPKPMIPIGGKPVLEHQILALKRYGVTEIYMLTGYLHDVIEGYLGDGSCFGVKITYVTEETPLGTAGAVRQLQGKINSDFVMVYGDILFDFKFDDLLAFHKTNKGAATLVVHPSDHPYDSDLVVVDEESLIIQILTDGRQAGYYANISNAAIYLLTPIVFKYIPAEGKPDFIKDVFPAMLKASEKLYAYRSPEYIKDMGTLDRLKRVETDFQTGKIRRLSKRFKRPAIFIDRDGSLVKDVDLLHKPESLELYEFSAQAIGKINRSDFLCILITNQPVVARNLCDIADVKMIHNKLETLLGKKKVYLDDIFFCPHHPDKGYIEENPLYKIDCTCRKPKIGMIDKAVSRYNIDIESSWFIGDATTDIQTGINAGLNTVLVRTGRGGKDEKYNVKPDFVFDDLKEAVDFITKGKNILRRNSQRYCHIEENERKRRSESFKL